MLRIAALAALLLAAAAPAAQAQNREIYHEFEGEKEFGYAQAVRTGTTLYISGTVSPGATMNDQVEGVYRRLRATLDRFGASPADIVKETVYTRDVDAFAAANAIRLRFLAGHTPAATWVQIQRLLMPDALVEVEMVVDLSRARPAS
ncbi:MAG TPA: RidA family protein [Longimicrobium sp.]|jgi:enamine deaminase RidA (YjgF/YER057c/UK114 family)|uniref:RidA family protein n=1 Tax=Longimicrobium sp. TaxID=2029185 RepID=UPI002ED9B45A